MVWSTFFRKSLSLPFSLWAMATVIFLLSRIIPNIYTPAGMTEADTTIYGTTNGDVRAKVIQEYRQRMGLDLPVFYFTISPTAVGTVLNQYSKETLEEQPWLSQYIKWYNKETVGEFLKSWREWNSTEKTFGKEALLQARAALLGHSESQSSESKKFYGLRFEHVLAKTGHKQPYPSLRNLKNSWSKMVASKAAFSGLIPVFHWHGANSQYHRWLTGLLIGNLGTSVKDFRPVQEKLTEALKTTIPISFFGLFLAGFLSYATGVLLTLYAESFGSKFLKAVLYLLDSIPAFLLTLVLFAAFVLAGGTLSSPVMAASESLWASFFTNSTLLLAGVSIALILIPHLSIQIYQSFSQEMSKPYLLTAKAKGVNKIKMINRHAWPNALMPVITLLSEVVIGLLAGVLIVEITFSLPGIGSLLTHSVLNRDYPVLIGVTLFLLAFRTVVVWLTDVAHSWADPRVR